MRTENPLHKQSEKAYMCFYTRRVTTRDFTVNSKIYPALPQLTDNFQFFFQFNFHDQWSIGFIMKSFRQFRLT